MLAADAALTAEPRVPHPYLENVVAAAARVAVVDPPHGEGGEPAGAQRGVRPAPVQYGLSVSQLRTSSWKRSQLRPYCGPR